MPLVLRRKKPVPGPKPYGSFSIMWSEIFGANEIHQRPDDELIAQMYEAFPERIGKTTITRVQLMRGLYNRGQNMFKRFGPAGSTERPYSICYHPATVRGNPPVHSGRRMHNSAPIAEGTQQVISFVPPRRLFLSRK